MVSTSADPSSRVPDPRLPALVLFVSDRLGEDERSARAAGSGRWVPAVGPDGDWLVTSPHAMRPGPGDTVAQVLGPAVQDHVVRWDPVRVLAECHWRRDLLHRLDDDVEALLALARLWAGHHDFRPDWVAAGYSQPG